MPEKNHVLWYVIGAAAAAGFVQLCTLLARDTLPLARQVIGAVGVAVAVSAVTTALGIDRLHLTPVTAGGLGIVSGLIPAGVWISVASRALEAQLREKLKVELNSSPAEGAKPTEATQAETPPPTAIGSQAEDPTQEAPDGPA